MGQEKRNPIISIDLQIRLRSVVYEVDLARVLKWCVTLTVIFARLYRWWLHGGG